MNIDEAIRHAEEVAEKNKKECMNWAYGASQINDDESRKKQYLKHAEMWQERAKEHRQLAEWLKELKVKRQIITNVKEQCKVWKRNDFQNRDYGIGFISALSNIEGLIAYTEEQLEVNADADSDCVD